MRIIDLPALRYSVHCRHTRAALWAAKRGGYTLPHCGDPLCSTCPGKYPPPLTARNTLTGRVHLLERYNKENGLA